MILYLLSVLLVCFSSYFLTSYFAGENETEGIFYLPLCAFANVVLTFEILSLFSAITVNNVLLMNFIFAGISAVIFYKSGKKFFKPDIRNFICRFKNSVILDKYLLFLSLGFLCLIAVSLFLIIFIPPINGDADRYHMLRSVFWVTNGSINHFITTDARNLILPINSEILYAWIILFFKKLSGFGIFSFIGYLMTVCAIYNILSIMKFSMRQKLWTIFMISSFASVIVQMSGTETDIIISGLVTSSIYLYWLGVKNGKTVPVYFSALSYALATGTKTPALMAIPATAIIMTVISVYYLKKDFYKPLLKFLGFAAVNFILFAFYNYCLNFIDYGNFVGSQYFMVVHKNQDGIKAIPANFIKYIFMFFDFTGFHWADFWGAKLIAIRDGILKYMGLYGISNGLYSSSVQINKSLLEPLMGLGILGMLVYLPCWIYSIFRPLFVRTKVSYILSIFGVMLLINLVVMSYQLQYMVYSIRFFMFFCLISSPVIVYTYFRKNNLYKFIVTVFALFYMILVSTHLWARPFTRIMNYFHNGFTLSQVRDTSRCSFFLKNINNFPNKNELKYFHYGEACLIKDFIQNKFDKKDKILFFADVETNYILAKMLDFQNYNIDYVNLENNDNIDAGKYNIIITSRDLQFITSINNFERRKNDFVFIPSQNIFYDKSDSFFPCIYLDINKKGVTENYNSNSIPFTVKCVIMPEFFKQNNFVRFARLKIDLPRDIDKTDSGYREYYFYKNLKNPPLKQP